MVSPRAAPVCTTSPVPFPCRYDCAADIWSFGMTLLELATGSAPYAQLSLDQIMIKTMNDEPPRLCSTDRRKKYTEAGQARPLRPRRVVAAAYLCLQVSGRTNKRTGLHVEFLCRRIAWIMSRAPGHSIGWG